MKKTEKGESRTKFTKWINKLKNNKIIKSEKINKHKINNKKNSYR
jgi:hypothetical protein